MAENTKIIVLFIELTILIFVSFCDHLSDTIPLSDELEMMRKSLSILNELCNIGLRRLINAGEHFEF